MEHPVRAFAIDDGPPMRGMTPKPLAYIYISGGAVHCALPDGTPASLTYAGIKPEHVMEAKIAGARAGSAEALAAAMAPFAFRGRRYEPV